jgi:hypothetical protein
LVGKRQAGRARPQDNGTPAHNDSLFMTSLADLCSRTFDP